MDTQPTLETRRLLLRAFTPSDAHALTQLAGRKEIADTTLSVPHPYAADMAKRWIAEQAAAFTEGKAVGYAVELRMEHRLIGSIGLRDIDPEHARAELGFWMGVDWWGKGYMTEAAVAMLAYGFEHLGLNRITAHYMVRNPGSGRVLEKIGMAREGLLRQLVRKWGHFEDVVVMAILRSDWERTAHYRAPSATTR